jgi:hypothetical protein
MIFRCISFYGLHCSNETSNLFGFEVKVSSPGKAILREVARVRLRPAMVPEIGPRPWQVLVVLLRHAEAGPDSGDVREISVAGVRKGLKTGQHKEVSLGPKIGQLIFKILVFHHPGISGFVQNVSFNPQNGDQHDPHSCAFPSNLRELDDKN